MFLPDIPDVRLGSTQVNEIRLGTNLVWIAESDPEYLWGFSTPSGGTKISLEARFERGIVSVDWGDGNTDRLSNRVTIEHEYL